MPTDLTAVFGDLDAIDARARSGATGDDEFAPEFTVPQIAFRDGAGPVPLRLAAIPELSENPLPIPAAASVTADGRLTTGDGLESDRVDVTVRKVAGGHVAHLAIACGVLDEGGVEREFVALGEPGTREFRISVRGTYTSSQGTLYTASFAGDGSILPEAKTGERFVAECDGSLFRLDEGRDGIRISEAAFGSLTRIEFSRGAGGEKAVLVGDLQLDGSSFPARVEFVHGPTRSTLSVVDTETDEQRVLGFAPAERVDFEVLGGLDSLAPTAGAVVVYERQSWEEIRRFPVDGALAGLAWNGSYLWQSKWPSGELVRIDPASADGDITVVPPPAGAKVAGVASDGRSEHSVLILGVCATDIMRGGGETYLAEYDASSGSELRRVAREHAVSSGISFGPDGLVGSVNGADQTPVSSASALLLIDRETGKIMGTVIFPRNFFIEDVAQASPTSNFVTVTEGLSGFKRPGAVYEVQLSAGS